MSYKQRRNATWIIPLFIGLGLFFPRLPYYIQLSSLIIALVIFIIQYINDKKRNKQKYPNHIYYSGFFTAVCIILYILGKNYSSINEDTLMAYLIAPGVLIGFLSIFTLVISAYKNGNYKQRRIAKLLIIYFIIIFILCLIILIKIVSMNL